MRNPDHAKCRQGWREAGAAGLTGGKVEKGSLWRGLWVLTHMPTGRPVPGYGSEKILIWAHRDHIGGHPLDCFLSWQQVGGSLECHM